VIPSQRRRFASPRAVASLNCAYMSPLMTEVVEAGRAAVVPGDHPGRLLRRPRCHPHLWNDDADVDRLIAALAAAV
jgi:selenocysteine lyase/cysteine desulfurase